MLTIVIPVYNEGGGILRVYEHLVKALTGKVDWQAYFVYDFDADITAPILQDLSQKDPRIKAVKQTYGRGFINALRFGFDHIAQGAVAVVMGDDSDELEKLPLMLALYQDGALVVAASRYSKGGVYQGGERLKKALSQLAGWLLYCAGIGTRDPTNNFKLYNSEFLKRVTIESRRGFEVALELTVKAALEKPGAVKEVPTMWLDRIEGESKFKLWQFLPFYLRWFFYFLYRRLLSPCQRMIHKNKENS